MSKHRNTRQRKKLRIGEFQELGFEVTADLNAGLDAAAMEAACDAFIVDCIEANRLAYGGASGNRIDGFVIAVHGRETVTEADREAVVKWLAARAEFQPARVGELTDVWYPDFA